MFTRNCVNQSFSGIFTQNYFIMSDYLAVFGFEAWNEMQTATFNAVANQKDVMLIAPTGSGKTLAFLVPLAALLDKRLQCTQLLIIVPSRELALQIEEVFRKMSTGFKVISCYGGHSVQTERNSLSQDSAVVVGTPGRLAHHLRKGRLNLSHTSFLVLDEFDKSLELGFQNEMEFILKHCTMIRRRVLTSATPMNELPGFTGITAPHIVNVQPGKAETTSLLTSKVVNVPGDDKLEALMLLLQVTATESAIVFCNHREAVTRISAQLHKFKIDHQSYHGALEQPERERALILFRNGSSRILLATDLAARGLDIPEVTSVIHYQLPLTEEIMIHRNGRTARMKKKGTAYYLLDHKDFLPDFVKDVTEKQKLPSTFTAPPEPDFKAMYFAAGKKDKLNKVDLVGFLMQKGKLNKDDIGRIDVLDHQSFVAIKKDAIPKLLPRIESEKIKNRKIKMGLTEA